MLLEKKQKQYAQLELRIENNMNTTKPIIYGSTDILVAVARNGNRIYVDDLNKLTRDRSSRVRKLAKIRLSEFEKK